jgi:hypothetical protein
MNDQQTAEQTSVDSRAKPRKRRWLRHAALACLLVPVVAVGVMFYFARSTPAHWTAYQKRLANTTPQQMESIARNVEQRLALLGISDAELAWQSELNGVEARRTAAARGFLAVGEDGSVAGANMSASLAIGDSAGIIPVKAKPLSEMRVDVERNILLSQEEIDALIITRLSRWMADRGYVMPSQIKDPMLQFTQNGLLMAFEYRGKNFSQVITAEFDMEILNDGYGELRLTAFDAGRLPVPASEIGNYLAKAGEDANEAAKVGTWLSRLEKLEFKPVLELENSRRVRVIRYRIKPEGVELTVRLQDRNTYRRTNEMLAAGKATLEPGSAIASVPTPLD